MNGSGSNFRADLIETAELQNSLVNYWEKKSYAGRIRTISNTNA